MLNTIIEKLSAENPWREQIQFFDTISSTNDVLKQLAIQGAPEGTVVIANAQTKGRGRRGRTFYSPGNTGIYLSLLLRPVHADPRQTVTLTAAAAAALCQAMEAVSGENPASTITRTSAGR